MNENLVGVIIWGIILAIVGIWKLLSKFLGGAETVRKVAEAGKQTKNLLDTLMGGDFEELKRALGTEEERKPTPEVAQEPEKVPPVSKPVIMSSQPPPSVAPPTVRSLGKVVERVQARMAEQPARQPQAKVVPRKRPHVQTEGIKPFLRTMEWPSGEEGKPSAEEGPTRRVQPPSPPAAPVGEPRPATTAAETPISVLGLLHRRHPKTLRELMILKEILGPPKCIARGKR